MADTSGSTDESRNRVPTPNNYEPDSHIPVTDGNTDVAQTLDGERMKVQAPGRLPMQRVYLLKGSANGRKSEQGLTNIPYDKKEDGPVMNPVGSLPSTQELVPGSHVVQYLEVGIVIGDDPSRFKPVRPLTNKKNKEGRKQRGDMPRHTSAIRAFIHISPTERSQAKCVVGVKPKDGYLNPRVIDSDCIFFYPEYWVGIEKGPKVTRRALMHARVKQLATNAEAQAERADATTTADKIAIPELLQGVKSFFDFDTELGLEDAESVARELKIAAPVVVDIVQATHRVMREHNLGDRLPQEDLAFFLEVCCKNISPSDIGEEVMVQEMRRALEMVEIFDRCKTR